MGLLSVGPVIEVVESRTGGFPSHNKTIGMKGMLCVACNILLAKIPWLSESLRPDMACISKTTGHLGNLNSGKPLPSNSKHLPYTPPKQYAAPHIPLRFCTTQAAHAMWPASPKFCAQGESLRLERWGWCAFLECTCMIGVEYLSEATRNLLMQG